MRTYPGISQAILSSLHPIELSIAKWDQGMSWLSNLLSAIPLSSLKISNLYTIPCSFYVSPNEQNWMCELCMFPKSDRIFSC